MLICPKFKMTPIPLAPRFSKGTFCRVAGMMNPDADVPVNRCRHRPASVDDGVLAKQDDFARRGRARVIDL